MQNPVKKEFVRYTPEDMANFATEAQNELIDIEDDAIKALGAWWDKWFMKAGHRRLGRILLEVFGDLSK